MSTRISSFLKIFVGILDETIIFGLAVVVVRAGIWPAYFAEEMPPDLLPLTVAIFSILVYLVAQFGTVKQIMHIADRYFNAAQPGQARIWPVPSVHRHGAARRRGHGGFSRVYQSGRSCSSPAG